MTSATLLKQYLAERHALGYSLKTDEGCLRRFLRNYSEPDNGRIEFTKEFVMAQLGDHGSSDITNSGIYHGIIYTNATSSHGDIYFERVYFDILVLP